MTQQPSYYNENGFSPIDAFKRGLMSQEEFLGFIKGNVIKYVIRAGKKDDAVSDIDKAINYLELMKEVIK